MECLISAESKKQKLMLLVSTVVLLCLFALCWSSHVHHISFPVLGWFPRHIRLYIYPDCTESSQGYQVWRHQIRKVSLPSPLPPRTCVVYGTGASEKSSHYATCVRKSCIAWTIQVAQATGSDSTGLLEMCAFIKTTLCMKTQDPGWPVVFRITKLKSSIP